MPVRGASAGRPASRSRPSRKSSERANAPALARQSARPCGPDLAARPGRPGDCWSRLPAAAGSGHCESPGGPNRVNDRGRGPRRTGLAARQHGRRAGPPPGRRARKSWRGRCAHALCLAAKASANVRRTDTGTQQRAWGGGMSAEALRGARWDRQACNCWLPHGMGQARFMMSPRRRAHEEKFPVADTASAYKIVLSVPKLQSSRVRRAHSGKKSNMLLTRYESSW